MKRGMVLLIVAVVVALLSLAGLGFVVTMQTENKAAHVQGRRLQIEHAVASGVEWVKAFSRQSWIERQEAGGSWDNAERFRDVLVYEDEAQSRRLRFSIVAPQTGDGEGVSQRFGLENESAKLNLGALLRWEEREPGAAQRALLLLPGMTNAIADSLLDWLDADDAARPLGAERDYYQGLGVPYGPRNGVPQCLEELLLIRDVTRGLVFGAEADVPMPSDVAGFGAGVPWAALVTVCSAERNESLHGQPRINLNQDDLRELHQRLAASVDPAWADFVVCYRQHGPYEGQEPVASAPLTVDLALPAKVRIESVLDVVNARIRLDVGDTPAAQIFASPWTTDPLSLRESLPKLLDVATVTDAPVIEGLVNVNLASRSVLLAVPGMDAILADRIVAVRGGGGAREDTVRHFPTWLLAEGLVDLPRMKALLPYLTGGGDVVRAQVIGFDDRGGPAMRVELVIDATSEPPRRIYGKELQLSERDAARASPVRESRTPRIRGTDL